MVFKELHSNFKVCVPSDVYWLPWTIVDCLSMLITSGFTVATCSLKRLGCYFWRN
jgi:hypothetical protein